MPKNALCRKVEPVGEWTIMGKTFTVYGSDTEPLILAKDVAEWINYSKNPNGSYQIDKMMKLVDEDEKLIVTVLLPGQNQSRKTWLVKEDGLYELLMLNRTEQGRKFKKEVKKILKHLRENGAYIVHKKDDNWNKIRIDSKEARKEFTEILSRFVEYAKGQGSQNANRYYKIFTNLIRDKLSIPSYLTKDSMSDEVLNVLNHYEFIVGRYILSQIEAKCPYKQIYKNCKMLIGQI